MNSTLETIARNLLKEQLATCTDTQQLMFKRMYNHLVPETPINEVVDYMDDSKLDRALDQVERTVNNNNKKATE